MNVNVDRDEIEKFSSWADIWWNPSGDVLYLHRCNPHRLGYIDDIAPLAGKRVLDVGCGGGILTESMAELGAHATGLDLAEGLLKAASMHAQEIGLDIRYIAQPVEELAQQEPGSYDVVTCMEMLEHVPDPASIVKSIGALVKPGGDVFISTMNRTPKAFLWAIVGAEYLLRIGPIGTHDWRKFITRGELKRYCRAAGLEVLDWKGIIYNPLTERFHLGRSTRVNYMLHARRVG